MQPLSESVGPLIKSSILGRNYWEAVGPVQKLFEDELAQTIKNYLDRCIEPSQDYLYWSIYMRGRTAETAIPYLVFSSEDEKMRKTACQMVKESNILKKFPTVKTTHARYPPDMSTLLRLLGDQVLDRDPDDKSYTHMVARDIYYKLSGNSMARELSISRLSTEERGRRATAGGIVCVGNRSFYLTVYHILEQEEHQQLVHDNELWSPVSNGNPNGEQIDADHGEESEEDEDEEEGGGGGGWGGEGEGLDDSGFEDGSPITYLATATTSDGDNGTLEMTNQLSEEPQHGFENDFSNLNEDLFIETQPPLHSSIHRPSDLGFTRLSSSAAIGSRSLDYLLIEVHDEDKEKTNSFKTPQNPSHTICVREVAPIGNEIRRVTIVSGCYGITSGSLFATPRFIRLPKSTTARKIFALQLDRFVQPGDCGSWAIDEASGYLYGHIFGGGVGTKTAYIISAVEIFEDVQRISRRAVLLPAAKDERQAISKTDSQSTLSKLLQLEPPQDNETVVENSACPANSGDVIDEYQHPLRNIFDRTLNDVLQVPSSKSSDMKTTSNEASKITADHLDPSQVDLSLKASPESSDLRRAATSQDSSPLKGLRSSATDDEASCWGYKPESSSPVFYYSPSGTK
ncbi:hypothetical protein BJY04DRAFT_225858 [Aspergillus karnatakaensis]|uniref:uncharacterized protein n=1 Tax=Aspergillus karnatakaensis TaxID=1810916 RepID=UPI003CCD9E9F